MLPWAPGRIGGFQPADVALLGEAVRSHVELCLANMLGICRVTANA
jgi:hypothetical protein